MIHRREQIGRKERMYPWGGGPCKEKRSTTNSKGEGGQACVGKEHLLCQQEKHKMETEQRGREKSGSQRGVGSLFVVFRPNEGLDLTTRHPLGKSRGKALNIETSFRGREKGGAGFKKNQHKRDEAMKKLPFLNRKPNGWIPQF